MGFKLVRVDSTDPCKIKLPVGTYDVGRGKLLCEKGRDIRVSRNHAQLVVTADEVTLTASHSNPCFYMKKHHTSIQILCKDNSIYLGCGDKFGILPDAYWYELIFCAELPEETETKEAVIDKAVDEDDEELAKDCDLEETDELIGEPSAPPDLPDRDSPTQLYDWCKIPSPKTDDKDDEKPQMKRPLTPNNDDADDSKKVKTDDDTADGAGPSNKASTSDDKAPEAIVRERCMYGATCYRKNPQHKAQYSHPADADWAAGEARACPWGAACRRRDPRHRRDCAHPQEQPQRDIRGKTKGNDDTSLIVNGKRERRQVKVEAWSGSESEGDKDPYATDESEEWQPSSDYPDSQGLTPD